MYNTDLPSPELQWEPLLSFRFDGLGNIALVDDMAEEVLDVRVAALDSEDAVQEQLLEMIRDAGADRYGPTQ